MTRLRWPESRSAVPIIATAFLNVPFWYRHGLDIWMEYPLPVYALLIALAATIMAALFFAGPAVAARQSGGVFAAVDRALGTGPGYVVRACCVVYVAAWVPEVTVLYGLAFRRGIGEGVVTTATAAVILFVFATALTREKTEWRLAVFSTKLSISILIAACIRVREGWPAVTTPWRDVAYRWPVDLWHGLSQLAFYAAPFALLAADYARKTESRKEVFRLAVFGIVMPAAAGLFIIGLLCLAIFKSPFYQPSLNPNILMALWGKAASSAIPPRAMIVAISTFGVLRFGVRAIDASVPVRRRPQRLAALAVAFALVVWFGVDPWAEWVDRVKNIAAGALVATAAVVTAGRIGGALDEARPFNWVGSFAFAAGAAFAWAVTAPRFGYETWFATWLLPSYAVAFVTCWLGTRLKLSRRV